MKQVFPVIFTQTDGLVLVEVKDMEILTQGVDLADAIEMARDAIGLKGISMEDAKEEIPQGSEVLEIDVTKGTFADEGIGFVSLVDVDFLEYRRKLERKMVRRNVTLPNWLNVEAEKAGLNVSKVLQEALMTRLDVAK